MIRFGEEVAATWTPRYAVNGAKPTVSVASRLEPSTGATRRYHGLLVATTKPPVAHPQGFQFLKQFRLDPSPTLTFSVDGIEIEKALFMVQGENTKVIEYRLTVPQMQRARSSNLPAGETKRKRATG